MTISMFMTELFEALVFSILWILAFGFFVDLARHTDRGKILNSKTVLIGYLFFCYFQILLAKFLNGIGQLHSLAFRASYLLIVSFWLIYFFKKSRLLPEISGLFQRLRHPQELKSIKMTTVMTLGLLFGVLAAAALILPVRMGDGLNFHMPMVANYIQNRSLDFWPTQCLKQIYRINGTELQQLNLALLARSDAPMELPNILALGAALIAVKALGDLLLGRNGLGWFAVLLTLTAPQMFHGAVLEGNDASFAAQVVVTFYFLVAAFSSPSNKVQDGLWLGLCVGLAQAAKILGVPLAIVTGACVFIFGVSKKYGAAFFGSFLGTSLVSTGILVGNIYAANFARSGSPFSVVPGYDETGFGISFKNLILGLKYYFYNQGVLRMFIPRSAWDGWYEGGNYGYFVLPVFIFGSLGLFRALMPNGWKKNSAVFGAGILSLWTLITVIREVQPEDQRFMVWLIPCLALFAIQTLQPFLLKHLSSAGAFVSGAALLSTLILFATPVLGEEFKASLKILFREHALARSLDANVPGHKFYDESLPAYRALEREAGPDSRILYIGSEYSYMYPCWGRHFERHVRGVSDLQDLEAALESGAYDFIVVEDAAAEALKSKALSAASQLGCRLIASAPERKIFMRVRETSPE